MNGWHEIPRSDTIPPRTYEGYYVNGRLIKFRVIS